MRVYTERPKRGNARHAWDYFSEQGKKSPIEMFYSQFTDLDDSRGPGWTARMGARETMSGCGATGGSLWFITVATDTLAWWVEKRA